MAANKATGGAASSAPTSSKSATSGTARKSAAAKRSDGKAATGKAPTGKAATGNAAAGSAAAGKAPTAKPATSKTATAKTATSKAPTGMTAAAATRARGTSAGGKAAATTQAAGRRATSAAPADPKHSRDQASGARRAAPGKAAPGALRVRDDESPWTAKELQGVREEVERDIEHLRAEIKVAEADLVGLMRDAGDGAGDDQADAGAKTYEREQELSLANNARDLLMQNLHALERIDDGSYGVCESCGHPIGKLRLQAAPRATLCVPCKTKQERR